MMKITSPMGGTELDEKKVVKALAEGTGLVFGIRIYGDGDSIVLQSLDPRQIQFASVLFDVADMHAQGIGSAELRLTPTNGDIHIYDEEEG
jgi:hypothetical protein